MEQHDDCDSAEAAQFSGVGCGSSGCAILEYPPREQRSAGVCARVLYRWRKTLPKLVLTKLFPTKSAGVGMKLSTRVRDCGDPDYAVVRNSSRLRLAIGTHLRLSLTPYTPGDSNPESTD